ncbi:NUDIX domain-containing protein [Halodesulfovibrio marinisediminis]|uniref:8-oxo-dGTP diphosphatase n=1 Tax=Halodesulfovibrio marinisediminis DSM 17456 TaxID=1121457 RepID=A0A1N6DEB3_9BACT|nr:NUDIX hydrolase [Halodesulfovibrio marinisediminis]SIN69138.1 8-oxo-dGTP diphosphatase [Halodesulfovibrio marinisediminis DSM 17456]
MSITYDIPCPNCSAPVTMYRNPAPTVDIVIYDPNQGVVLIERANEPHGWALPGGFIDYGETCEAAAIREAKEETNLDVTLTELIGVYSDPTRDPRHHTMSVAYSAVANDVSILTAGDDAQNARFFPLESLPHIVFDHNLIVEDFAKRLKRLNK